MPVAILSTCIELNELNEVKMEKKLGYPPSIVHLKSLSSQFLTSSHIPSIHLELSLNFALLLVEFPLSQERQVYPLYTSLCNTCLV
jgi:hypothetical protein